MNIVFIDFDEQAEFMHGSTDGGFVPEKDDVVIDPNGVVRVVLQRTMVFTKRPVVLVEPGKPNVDTELQLLCKSVTPAKVAEGEGLPS